MGRFAFWPWERRIHISLDNLTTTLCGKTLAWWGTWEAANNVPYDATCEKCVKEKGSRNSGYSRERDTPLPG